MSTYDDLMRFALLLHEQFGFDVPRVHAALLRTLVPPRRQPVYLFWMAAEVLVEKIADTPAPLLARIDYHWNNPKRELLDAMPEGDVTLLARTVEALAPRAMWPKAEFDRASRLTTWIMLSGGFATLARSDFELCRLTQTQWLAWGGTDADLEHFKRCGSACPPPFDL
jgi:hypothetical protein